MQYTIRNIPALLDRMLRRRARERGASLNEVAIEALSHGVGLAEERVQRRSLSDLAGAWVDDPEFGAAVREQDAVDGAIWR